MSNFAASFDNQFLRQWFADNGDQYFGSWFWPNTLDVYINGSIIKSHHLHGVPKQNYGDVYIAPNGGFAGYISNLWYYNYALSILFL